MRTFYSADTKSSSLSDIVDELLEIILKDMAEQHRKLLLPGRVVLGAADLKHGEIVEVIITSTAPTPPSLEDKENTDGQNTETIIFRFRVVDWVVSWRVSPQFVLAKRLETGDDGWSDRAGANPGVIKPAPGVALTFRFRWLSEWTDWVVPSIGLTAVALDFDENQPVELGLGSEIGLLNELIHFGVGYNLFIKKNDDPWYFTIGLDFIQGYDVFSSLHEKD